MNPTPLNPIPMSGAQRLRVLRGTALPWIVFAGALCAVAFIWNGRIGSVNMLGQAEPIVANVSSHESGILAGFNVVRFQKVKAGDTLGRVIIADPQLIESSLAVIRSELEVLRAGLNEPEILQRRYAVDFAQLRIEWMRQRAELASAKVNLQYAQSELQRTEELFKEKIASQAQLDLSRANHDALVKQVEEFGRLVKDGEMAFEGLKQPGPMDTVIDNITRATIAGYEAQLRQVESELRPVTIRAPMDGTVTAVFFRSGESVTRGMPIVSIAADTATRITGYMRQPVTIEPKPGDTVQVRMRSGRREMVNATILDVGAQFEPLPLQLQSPMKLVGVELMLPLNISIPNGVSLRPGELVDITLAPQPVATQH